WGENVDSVAPGTGFEICTVISQCQATNPATGDLGGEMSAPSGIATDSAGGVYRANSAFNRTRTFDWGGHFRRACGSDVLGGGSGGAGGGGGGGSEGSWGSRSAWRASTPARPVRTGRATAC